MTIDEMICALYKENFTVRDAESITAALRAGQAMSDAANSMIGNYQPISKGLHTAIVAWDAVTKGDV